MRATGIILDVVFGEGFPEEMVFSLNPEGREGGSLAKSPENSMPGMGNGEHSALGWEHSLVCSQTRGKDRHGWWAMASAESGMETRSPGPCRPWLGV